MEVFKTLKNNLIVLGISLKQSMQARPLNGRIALGSITIGLSVLSHAAFLLNVADGFTEYIQSIYWFSATLLIAVSFANIVLKMTKLFKFFDNLDQFVNESE